MATVQKLMSARRPQETTELMREHRWRDPLDLDAAGIYAIAKIDGEKAIELAHLREMEQDGGETFSVC